MPTEVRILECSKREGTSKNTGKPYLFYTGKLFSSLGVIEFISNEEFKSDVEEVLDVVMSQDNGKFTIKHVE